MLPSPGVRPDPLGEQDQPIEPLFDRFGLREEGRFTRFTSDGGGTRDHLPARKLNLGMASRWASFLGCCAMRSVKVATTNTAARRLAQASTDCLKLALHWASSMKSFKPNRERTVDLKQCEGVTDVFDLCNLHSGKNRIAA